MQVHLPCLSLPLKHQRNIYLVKTSSWYLLLALAGAAGGFAFPPSIFGVLAFVAFVPLIIALEQEHLRFQRMRLLYTFFFCFHGAANWWVMSWQQETDPFLMAAGAGLWLGHPFFLMPAFWIYLYLRKRVSLTFALGALPLLWTAVEWLHSLGDLSYPWLAVGYTQTYYTWLIQIADLGGVWIVSFLVMMLNALAAHWWLKRQRLGIHLAVGGGVISMVLLYGITQTIAYTHGFNMTAPKSNGIMFGVVQPDIDPWDKWQHKSLNEMVDLHRHLQDSLNALQHCDVSVWSETAIPVDVEDARYQYTLTPLRQWIDSSNTALLTGCADFVYYPAATAPANARPYRLDESQKYKVYNSAAFLLPHQPQVAIHHKSRLTPFGEGVPYSDELTFLQSWLQWGVGISGWNKGEGATVLSYPPTEQHPRDTIKMGPVICIESIYPNYVADYVRKGANILSVITNDAWYDGTFGPEQHYCIARMRAVETRREIVRCGNSGVSGFISATGQSLYQAKPMQSLATAHPMFLEERQSFYVRFGDWLPQLCSLFTVGIMLWVRIRKSKVERGSADNANLR